MFPDDMSADMGLRHGFEYVEHTRSGPYSQIFQIEILVERILDVISRSDYYEILLFYLHFRSGMKIFFFNILNFTTSLFRYTKQYTIYRENLLKL